MNQFGKSKQTKLQRYQKKLHKYLEFFLTKFQLLLQEKKFHTQETTLKYMLQDGEQDTLVVVFSACTRKGLRARYNYVRTLKNCKKTKLFILDDKAADHRGGYYIGSDFRFQEEKATKDLLDAIIQKVSPKKIIFCGSSKGAWAALNFGLQYPNSYIIAGAPQYYLATYLIEDDSLITLEHIIGERTAEKVEYLDTYLKNRITQCKNHHNHLFLHYSNQEHTYFEHIKDMVEDLETAQYQITYHIESYLEHSDISYYFPDFLVSTIENIS